MLLKPQTRPCYLYQQYRSDTTMLKFFSLLDSFKTINYNYNPQTTEQANNTQENFYNLSRYSYFFLQCIYGFKYTIIESNISQNYYDTSISYDSKKTYDSNVNPLRTRFFIKELYKRKPKANRIFTIADFVYIVIKSLNSQIQKRNSNSQTKQKMLSYNDIKIEFIPPNTNNTNNTNQTLWVITIYNVNISDFNLFVSYLQYNKNHLPFCFNYRLIPLIGAK